MHAESWRMDQNRPTKVPTVFKTPSLPIPNLSGAVWCAWGVCAARFQQGLLGPRNPAKVGNANIRDLRLKSYQIVDMCSGSVKMEIYPIRETPWGVRIHFLDLLCGRFTSGGHHPQDFVKFVKKGLLNPIFT